MGQASKLSPDTVWVPLGLIGRPHGLRGWVYCYPQSTDFEALLAHPLWQLQFPSGKVATYTLEQGKVQAKGLLLHFEGCNDRDAAQLLTNAVAAIPREDLAPPEEGSFYWADLIGLEVQTLEGQALGQIIEMYDNGAHDVAILGQAGKATQQVPFIWQDTVRAIDWDARTVQLDWPADIL